MPFAYFAALSEGTPASAVPKVDIKSYEEISLFTTKIFRMTNHFALLMLCRFRQELAQFSYSWATQGTTNATLYEENSRKVKICSLFAAMEN